MTINVAIFPSFNDWLENRLFDVGTSFDSVYKDAFSLFRKEASRIGFNLNTWDTYKSISEIQVAWFLDLPESRREYVNIRKSLSKSCYRILQVLESPVIRPHSFIEQNHVEFHKVLCYNKLSDHPPQYYNYSLPYTFSTPRVDKSYLDRSGVVMLNSNRLEGLFAKRRTGIAGLPLIGKLICGWHAPLGTMAEILKGERYTYRRRLARAAEAFDPEFFHIYGSGWNGEDISWLPIFPNRPYKCWKGKTSMSKLEICSRYKFVIAIENYEGDRGYISEKIFDAFCAGSVPVYLGDEHADSRIGSETFVDASKFENFQDLLKYLKAMPEKTWRSMRDAGLDFLKQGRQISFSNEQFAEKALQVLKDLRELDINCFTSV